MTDWLDSETCECGQPIATHSPLAPAKPWAEGRPCNRDWPHWKGVGQPPEWRPRVQQDRRFAAANALQINRPRSHKSLGRNAQRPLGMA